MFTAVVVVLIVVVVIHCQYSSHNTLHEQLLKELGVGGMSSAVHTHDPPYKQWLIGMEHVCEQ
jgi:hypothetical protein